MGLVGYMRHAVEQRQRRRFFLQNFANGDELYESLRTGNAIREAVCSNGLVIRHPALRSGLANMILEVWEKQVYTGSFFTPPSGGVVIDAGANIGLLALHVARREPRCSVHCFEPFPENFQLLSENVMGLASVKVYQVALGARRGQIGMVDGGSRSQDHRVAIPSSGVPDTEMWAFADALEATGSDEIDLFKCDIEGAEAMLFSSASDADLRRVARFAIEYHDNLEPGTSTYLVKRLAGAFEVRVQRDPGDYGMIYATRSTRR